jgi:hypothetical protein
VVLQDELRAGRAPTAEPRRRRWDLLAAWGVILLPALFIAAVMAVRQRVGDLEDRLVREANALFARTNPRPVHRGPPAPGALGDALAIHLPGIARAGKLIDEEARGPLREIAAGERPVGALAPAAAAAIREAGPDLDAILRATRSERADLGPALGLAGGLEAATLQLGALLSAVRVRQALGDGQPGRAAEEALDALALGRDAAIGGALVGHMIGAAIVARTAPSGASAFDALPDGATRSEAMASLRRIRDAFPAFSRTLADEVTLSQLMIGQAMSARALAALDPRALAMMREAAFDGWAQHLVFRDAWRDMRRAQDRMVAAADLPEQEREAAWEAALQDLKHSINPMAQIGMPDYGRYRRRADAALRRLDALVLVCAAGRNRMERGEWPGQVEALVEAGGLQPAEADRLGKAVLAAQRDGSLALTVPLPRADEKHAEELRFVLRSSRR